MSFEATAMVKRFSHGYALMVGVGQSTYEDWALPVASEDARALRAVLADPSSCAYPNDDTHFHVLLDQAATREGIVAGLKWLADRVRADSDATAIVYFSGHGWLDRNDKYYLIPYDVDPLDIRGTALPALDFTDALRVINPKRLLVILDCCHAGGMATSKGGSLAPPGLRAVAPPKGLLTALRQGAGRAVFSSSLESQKSWPRPDGRMSIYTHHLIEALRGAGNKPGDTEVRLTNLMEYLSQAVPESARMMGRDQTPFFDTASENFTIALLMGSKGVGSLGGIPSLQHAPQPSNTTQFEINNHAPNKGFQGTFNAPITQNIGWQNPDDKS